MEGGVQKQASPKEKHYGLPIFISEYQDQQEKEVAFEERSGVLLIGR